MLSQLNVIYTTNVVADGAFLTPSIACQVQALQSKANQSRLS